MDVFLKNKKRYSFSPDQILNGNGLNAYELIKEKNFNNSLKLFYKILGNIDKQLEEKGTLIGLKRSIINEIFINSSIFFFIYFLEHKKIKNNISKIEVISGGLYLKSFLKRFTKAKIVEVKINKKLKYNRLQILKQLNIKEINFYLKKKIYRFFNTKNFNQIIYKECPLLVNELGNNLKKSLFIRNNLKKTKFEDVKKNIKLDKELLNSFDPFINSFRCNKLVKSIIINLYNIGYNKYQLNYLDLKENLKNYNIERYSNFHTSQLTNAQDFALMDLVKHRYNSKIITYQHGHGQGLSKYHEQIKFIKETSYGNINYVFSKNAEEYNNKNNVFSMGKSIISKYYYPYNKFLTKLNICKKKFDVVYFSPWHMNGVNHSLYNYAINDLEKIKIESDLIKNYLSKANSEILIKKYPYDSQKYRSENHIGNLVSNYRNLTFYNKTLKYPEFYKKGQIILLFGCSSTFGYLASFHNPIIMVNLKNYFPIKKDLENNFRKSIFLVNYGENNYKELLKKLITNKKYIYEEWEKKTIYREKFYKKFLGIE